MSIFMMVMIGGGIIFIDDKARGLHEGYLVTPITKLELIARLQPVGHDQGRARGGRADDDRLLIAGIPNPFEPMRLIRLLRRHRRSRPSR